MTANKTTVPFFAVLLAGGLALFQGGCGYGGESESTIGENGEIVEQPAPAATPAANGSAAVRTASGGTSGGNAVGESGAGATQTGGGTGEIDAASVDQVPFSALHWKFGGVSGGRASLSTPRLANLRCSGNTLSYKWVVGLNTWGYGHNDAGAICAAFVQKTDGSWVGGKFDWVSTSRSSRDLQHILSGYGGWSLEGVPNPCLICFVVIDGNAKRRSNVIGPATWKR